MFITRVLKSDVAESKAEQGGGFREFIGPGLAESADELEAALGGASALEEQSGERLPCWMAASRFPRLAKHRKFTQSD